VASPSSQDSHARALAFERDTLALVVDEVRRIDQGWVIRAPSLPEVWVFNNVWLDTVVGYFEAVELCRRYLPDSGFDQLFIEDYGAGERLADSFRRDGWEVDVDVRSVLTGRPDRRVETEAVIEADEEQALDLMARWMREDETIHLTEAGARQLREGNRLTWRARGARRLGICDQAGRLVALTLLYSDGRIAQVEDVYTVPEARGRGYARMLVTRAIDLALQAGHELTFIVADDHDWPKQLYRKLGFEPVGRSWLFHRDHPARSRA
jgi:GNAT superfamily N-acetyltransferase